MEPRCRNRCVTQLFEAGRQPTQGPRQLEASVGVPELVGLKIDFSRLAYFVLKPSWKDAPRRELSYALNDASKHATGDDFEAIYWKRWFSCGFLTISINICGLACGFLTSGRLRMQFSCKNKLFRHLGSSWPPWITLHSVQENKWFRHLGSISTPWI